MNIYDDNYRKKFLTTANNKALNDYLKNMEKLSKKGGKHLDMYNKDMAFLMQLWGLLDDDNDMCDEGMIQVFGKPREIETNEPILTEMCCDTEMCINNVDNICKGTFDDLERIGDMLIRKNNKGTGVSNYVREFIDIVCESDKFEKKNRDQVCRWFRKIGGVIVGNNVLNAEAYKYLNIVLGRKKYILSDEFMKKYAEMRSKGVSKVVRTNFVNECFEKTGFQIICFSRFIEGVVNSYKNNK